MSVLSKLFKEEEPVQEQKPYNNPKVDAARELVRKSDNLKDSITELEHELEVLEHAKKTPCDVKLVIRYPEYHMSYKFPDRISDHNYEIPGEYFDMIFDSLIRDVKIKLERAKQDYNNL